MWGIQVFDGEKNLPELIVDADKQHDAERAYCEYFNLDYEEISNSSTYYWDIPYGQRPRFIRSEPEFMNENFDLQVF